MDEQTKLAVEVISALAVLEERIEQKNKRIADLEAQVKELSTMLELTNLSLQKADAQIADLERQLEEAIVSGDAARFKLRMVEQQLEESQKVVASENAKANFLWPHEDGSIEEAAYELVNAKTEKYRQEWWGILYRRSQLPVAGESR